MNSVIMRTVAASFLSGVFSLSAMSGLEEIAKPYLGTYDCEQILWNGEDVLDSFDFVRMELLANGLYKIEFQERKGVKGLYRGKYSFDTENKELRIDETIFGKKVSKSFSVVNGVISVPVQFGNVLLYVKFKMR